MFSLDSPLRRKFKRFIHLLSIMLAILIFSTYNLSAIAVGITPKDITINTIKANAKVYRDLDYSDLTDWESATKGFMGKLPYPAVIDNGEVDSGRKVYWDLGQYKFLITDADDPQAATEFDARIPTTNPDILPDAPSTANPSLWRNAQLNMQHGLYKVYPDPDVEDISIPGDIYQLRGYDLSVMTLVKSDNGWIVIDPLTSQETAETALALAHDSFEGLFSDEFVNDDQGKLPVSAVIYTHSHIDHFGGVRGVVDEDNVFSGDVVTGNISPTSDPTHIHIYAPEGFLEEAVSENVLAGNVMSRRASYMYGNLIPKIETGQIDGGLGKTTSSGTPTLIPPTDIIDSTTQPTSIDGVAIEFQNVPGSEAPAEMLFYFPGLGALCASEDATHTMHNLYTLRGAKVRDALGWAKYLNETIERFGSTVAVVFASHHWPTWGNTEVVDYLKKQRDLYKYIHDQTLRYANQGYTMLEIAEMLELPPSLAEEWYNRGYYGSLSHDVKAVYQRYLGWFDGNPANLHELPPEQAGDKYIEYMTAGVNNLDGLVAKARAEYDAAQNDDDTPYRWIAKLMSHVVFGHCKDFDIGDNTDCDAARNLEADALEQLGYQAESGPWRNFYLTGALELRNPINPDLPTPEAASPDIVTSMTAEMFFDYIALHVKGLEAALNNENYTFNIVSLDEQTFEPQETYFLELENGVLNYAKRIASTPGANTTIYITRSAFNDIILEGNLDGLTMDNFHYEGNIEDFKTFINGLDKFEFWFGIVTP